MNGWGVFAIILVIVLIGGGGGYIGYAHWRARRLGLPPPNLKDLNPFSKNRSNDGVYRAPAPAPGGIQGWVADKWNSLRNQRTAGGAYENTGYGGGQARGGARGRGFGPLDPDEAWDARVDNEASGYYGDDQELGLQDPGRGPYGGNGYGDVGVGGIEAGRGRSRSRQRELDNRYDEEVHHGGLNPFGDNAETSNMSLRGVSPRPDTEYRGGASAHKKQQSAGTTASGENISPSERRSLFHEDV